MHAEAFYAAARLLAAVPLGGARVLELGSYNVNGSVRPLLAGASAVVGLDLRAGPGVDVVADAASYLADVLFDLIISTEMLEHAPEPAAILDRCWQNLRPGGWLVITAAGPGRQPHSCDGWPTLPPGEHYANITPADLRAWLADWADVLIETNPAAGDIYARARRPPYARARRPPVGA